MSRKKDFRFPATIHHRFAYWIEEPLGWPNGDAGDCFMFDLYAAIAKATGWQNGEAVFGSENIPDLTLRLQKRFVARWLPLLHPSLSATDVEDKGKVLTAITLPEWVAWLTMIRKEIAKKRAG